MAKQRQSLPKCGAGNSEVANREAFFSMNVSSIDFVNRRTGAPLVEENGALVDSNTKESIAVIRDGIPRFVDEEDDYADSFGFQWNMWHSVMSESRSNYHHAQDLKSRSGLWEDDFDAKGKTLLECGMGGGDDTEVLLTLPLAELHSFDISQSVNRAAKFLEDERLRISQASIFDIPYPPESFDIVWCHRVVMHTPDPEEAIRSVCRMVKPGGFLFLHTYKRSRVYMQEFRYRYRGITSRLPKNWVYNFIRWFGKPLHYVNRIAQKSRVLKWLAYRYNPFYYVGPSPLVAEMSNEELIEFERIITFDALTPAYDNPMTTETFTSILKEEGFDIVWLHDPEINPLLARAVKAK